MMRDFDRVYPAKPPDAMGHRFDDLLECKSCRVEWRDHVQKARLCQNPKVNTGNHKREAA